MKKLNNYYLSFGVILTMISIISSRYDLLPDFFKGFCLSLGTVLMLRGILAYIFNSTKFKSCKMTLIQRYFG